MKGCAFIVLIFVWLALAVFGAYMFLTVVAGLEPWIAAVIVVMMLLLTWVGADD